MVAIYRNTLVNKLTNDEGDFNHMHIFLSKECSYNHILVPIPFTWFVEEFPHHTMRGRMQTNITILRTCAFILKLIKHIGGRGENSLLAL
jgi:hypothetical protein